MDRRSTRQNPDRGSGAELVDRASDRVGSAPAVAPVVLTLQAAPRHNVIREPSDVEAMFLHNGKVRILRFTWKGRSWPVVSQGRQRDTGGELRTSSRPRAIASTSSCSNAALSSGSSRWPLEDRLVA